MFSDIIRHMPARGLLAHAKKFADSSPGESALRVGVRRCAAATQFQLHDVLRIVSKQATTSWSPRGKIWLLDVKIRGHPHWPRRLQRGGRAGQGLGVAELPSFRYFLPHDHEGTIYDGERSFNALFSFVQALSLAALCQQSERDAAQRSRRRRSSRMCECPLGGRSKTMERRMLAQQQPDVRRERLLLDFERTGSEKRSTSSKAFKKHVEELESAFQCAGGGHTGRTRAGRASGGAMRAVEPLQRPRC